MDVPWYVRNWYTYKIRKLKKKVCGAKNKTHSFTRCCSKQPSPTYSNSFFFTSNVYFGICLFVEKIFLKKGIKGRATSIIELVDTLLSDRYTRSHNNNKIRKTSKHT